MRYLPILLAAALFAGCSADTMETAATAAALKAEELEQGERTRADALRRIDAATDEMRKRQQRTAEDISGY